MKQEIEKLVKQVTEMQADIASMKDILRLVDISVSKEKDKAEVAKLEDMIDSL
jgi:hypothetical protein